MGLLQGPRVARFLVSEVPQYIVGEVEGGRDAPSVDVEEIKKKKNHAPSEMHIIGEVEGGWASLSRSLWLYLSLCLSLFLSLSLPLSLSLSL